MKKFFFLILFYTFICFLPFKMQAQYQPQHETSVYLKPLTELDGKIRWSTLIEYENIGYEDPLDVSFMLDSINRLVSKRAEDLSSKIKTTTDNQYNFYNANGYKEENRINIDVDKNNNPYKLLYDIKFYVWKNYINIVIDNVKFFFPDSKKIIPAENIISDKVALDSQKTNLVSDKADYRMFAIDTFIDLTHYFSNKLNPESNKEQYEEQYEETDLVTITQIDENGNEITEESDTIEIDEEPFVQTVTEGKKLPTVETNLGNFSVLSDRYVLINSIMKRQTIDAQKNGEKEQQIYIITQDGFIAKAAVLTQSFISQDMLYVILEADRTLNNTVFQDLKENDIVTLSVIAPLNSSKYQITSLINKQLKDTEKLNLSSLQDYLPSFSITPDGGVAINGAYTVLTVRKVNNVLPAKNNPNSNNTSIFQILNTWGEF